MVSWPVSRLDRSSSPSAARTTCPSTLLKPHVVQPSSSPEDRRLWYVTSPSFLLPLSSLSLTSLPYPPLLPHTYSISGLQEVGIHQVRPRTILRSPQGGSPRPRWCQLPPAQRSRNSLQLRQVCVRVKNKDHEDVRAKEEGEGRE